MLLVVARLSQDPEATAHIARVTGLPMADVSRRLAGTLPRVLLPAVSGDQVDDLVSRLEALGLVAFSCDAAAAPGDTDRTMVRALELGSDGLVAFDGQGQPHACPYAAMAVIQRGVRITVTHETVTTTSRKIDVGKALLSGGLMLTSKVKQTLDKKHEQRENLLLIQRSDGEPDLAVYERRLDYRFLGSDRQPASHANLEITLVRLQALAPTTPVDNRATKPGFVSGLPLTHADPLDLALFLISLARIRGC
jgi:hypothetical protein